MVNHVQSINYQNNISRIIKLIEKGLPILMICQDQATESLLLEAIYLHPKLANLNIKSILKEYDLRNLIEDNFEEIIDLLQLRQETYIFMVLRGVDLLTPHKIANLNLALSRQPQGFFIVLTTTATKILDVKLIEHSFLVRAALDLEQKLSQLIASGISKEEAYKLLKISGESLSLVYQVQTDKTCLLVKEKTFSYIIEAQRMDLRFIKKHIFQIFYWLQSYAIDLYLISIGLTSKIRHVDKKSMLVAFVNNQAPEMFLDFYRQLIFLKQQAFMRESPVVTVDLIMESLWIMFWLIKNKIRK